MKTVLLNGGWGRPVNAVLGATVVTIGGWLAWDQAGYEGLVLFFAAASAFLMWRGRTIGLIWAWVTLLLGVESVLWPIITMVQIRAVTDQPSDQQMGVMLSAVVMGMFSSVFWLAFSYGLFRRAGAVASGVPAASSRVNRQE
ncbi:MAG TPA: hypothetical protein VFS39_10155 [Nitrospira sp.]|nr:hypothetical protein [Nitrospira sp.]